MHVVPTTFDGPTIKPYGAFICLMVSVSVTQFPDVRWSPYVDSIFMNQDSLWKREILCKDIRLIKDTIPVLIDKTHHSVLGIFQLDRGFGCIP